MSDAVVWGNVDMGTQQQYFMRNANLSSVSCSNAKCSMNYVFLGVEGAPLELDHGQVRFGLVCIPPFRGAIELDVLFDADLCP